jgi:hypothetical protein
MNINLYEIVNEFNQLSPRNQLPLLPEGISSEESIKNRDFSETCNQKCFIHQFNLLLEKMKIPLKITVSASFQIQNEPIIVFSISSR